MVERVTSRHDVELRLHNTFVLYEGRVYYAMLGCDGGATVDLRDPREVQVLNLSSIDANSSKIDVNNFNLGYMNYGSSTYFVERVPYRQQKQGLTRGQLAVYGAGLRENQGCGSNLFHSQGMVDMLQNVYRPADVCLTTVLSSVDAARGGVAVSTDFCFRMVGKKDIDVLYKQNNVGILDRATGVVKLTELYNHSIMHQKLSKLGFTVG